MPSYARIIYLCVRLWVFSIRYSQFFVPFSLHFSTILYFIDFIKVCPNLPLLQLDRKCFDRSLTKSSTKISCFIYENHSIPYFVYRSIEHSTQLPRKKKISFPETVFPIAGAHKVLELSAYLKSGYLGILQVHYNTVVTDFLTFLSYFAGKIG